MSSVRGHWGFQSIGVFALSAVMSLMLVGCASHVEPDAGLELTLLHTNDTHSFAAGISPRSTPCLASDDCFGGYARVVQAVTEEKKHDPEALFLDAGDAWQGTLFFKTYGPQLIEEFAPVLGWDAATLGNHEFDRGCRAAVDYVGKLSMPVLVANIGQSACPLSQTEIIKPWVIRTVKGVRVGLIGMANDEAKDISKACPETVFLDRRESLQKAVDELRKEGVHHIVVISHLGYPADCKLAHTVSGIDVIVGGHTHDVLGDYPGSVGPYPTVVKSPENQDVLVVTAKRGTEFLGRLDVRFDVEGNVVAFVPRQVHLTPEMPSDERIKKRVDAMAEHINALRGETITHNTVEMPDGLDACREEDCLSAMITTDAMLAFGKPYGAQIAVINAGAVRDALPLGEVKKADVASVHPFNDRVYIRELTGSALLAAIEHGTSDPKVIGPYILQSAGLRYRIDYKAKEGKRTDRVEVFQNGRWQAVDPEARYRVVVNAYLNQGGDGFSMIAQAKSIDCAEVKTVELFERSLASRPTVAKPAGGRIFWKNR